MKPTIFRDISNEDGWIGFLQHLADEEMWDANQIINVVEKSWHWEKAFDEFIRATDEPGQPDRDVAFETLTALLNGWRTPAEVAEEEAEWAAEEAALGAKEARDGRTS